MREQFWQPGKPRSLTLWPDTKKSQQEIARFSQRDAQSYPEYERQLQRIVNVLEPLLDNPAPNVRTSKDGFGLIRKISPLAKLGVQLGKDSFFLYELLTSSASKVLSRWFESDPLLSTLASDGVVGATLGPQTTGSSYVLLHHVMGGVEGISGAWGYPEGGMGAVSEAIARSAAGLGVDIFVNKPVQQISVSGGKADGVVLADGTHITAPNVLSNATAHLTYTQLLPKNVVPDDLYRAISNIDYTSPVTKINVAVSRLPSFIADPNLGPSAMPHYQASIHINSETLDVLQNSYEEGLTGIITRNPKIEMVIPSSLDPTLTPSGAHVCLLFTQYTPYYLAGGQTWNQQNKKLYSDIVFDAIEEFAPGFRESILGFEVLTPPDLEQIFGLTGGNIFHGSLALDQLYWSRPDIQCPGPQTCVPGVYICGSGSHPGGGVMGSPGRLAAMATLSDNRKQEKTWFMTGTETSVRT